MPTKLYWRLAHHANRSAERRAQHGCWTVRLLTLIGPEDFSVAAARRDQLHESAQIRLFFKTTDGLDQLVDLGLRP